MLLERLLAGLEVVVAPFAVCDVRGSAHLAVPAADEATLHYVLAGAGTARTPGAADVALRPHTFMVLPPGLAHRVEPARGSVIPELSCGDLAAGMRRISAGRGVHGVALACGTIRATYRRGVGLFRYLRAPLVEALGDGDPLRHAFDAFLGELAAPQPGTPALAQALMTQCLVLLLRRRCQGGECREPWLAALDDDRLGTAVAAILEAPEAPFTVERLAALAGMSRSAFALRFAEAFGRPPMAFLKEVRLARAAQMLRTSDLPVKRVAGAVGYASRSYFSRAFKAFHGLDPAAYRSRAEAPPPS